MRWFAMFLVAGMLVPFCSGCGRQPASRASGAPSDALPGDGLDPKPQLADSAAADSRSTRPEAASQVNGAQIAATPTVQSWNDVERWIAAQKGKVVIVDLWSTWCAPCVREFPDLAELARTFPDDVVCLGFNLDYSGAADENLESIRQSVAEFLAKQNAHFPNAVSADPADDVFHRLELASIPAVLVYDREGRLNKRFDNDDAQYGDAGFTYAEHVVPWLERLRVATAAGSVGATEQAAGG